MGKARVDQSPARGHGRREGTLLHPATVPAHFPGSAGNCRAPAEDAASLLAEAGEVLDELESLIRRINAAILVEGGTLTDALARRDVLPALPVADLRRQADDLARQLREVDTRANRLPSWRAEGRRRVRLPGLRRMPSTAHR
ncbi:DIP1984 family protein [Paractinoplanes globisporus]|uniref:Uncharacterized protein n=1 Tax=Paractinoplanes globisporus TaxID=113565 RepID=A0ABW6WMY2_9ACTN